MYEYRCRACEHQETLLEKSNAARTKKCPACGKRSFTRLISAAAFHLKGSGWYVTDFRDKKKDEKKDEKPKEEKSNNDKSGGEAEKTKKSDKADDKTKKPSKETAEKKPAATDKPKNKASK